MAQGKLGGRILFNPSITRLQSLSPGSASALASDLHPQPEQPFRRLLPVVLSQSTCYLVILLSHERPAEKMIQEGDSKFSRALGR